MSLNGAYILYGLGVHKIYIKGVRFDYFWIELCGRPFIVLWCNWVCCNDRILQNACTEVGLSWQCLVCLFLYSGRSCSYMQSKVTGGGVMGSYQGSLSILLNSSVCVYKGQCLRSDN